MNTINVYTPAELKESKIMNIPRWIKDNNPDESIESRIENLINKIVNGDYPDIRSFLGYIASELISIHNKIIKENQS